MDAATRGELDRLRLRAYGPAADIDDDPAALRRLIDLEAQALRDRAVADTEEAPPAPVSRTKVKSPESAARTGESRGFSLISDGEDERPRPQPRKQPAPRAAASTPAEPAPPRRAPRPDPRPRRRAPRRTVLLACAAVALVAAGLGSVGLVRAVTPPETAVATRAVLAPAVREARAAYQFAWGEEIVPLLHIPLDGSFGRYIDLPTSADVPEFPSTGTVEWAYPLGKYFGWDVWIAGASVDGTGLQREHCIVVERDDDRRGRCVPAAVRRQSALLVSVAFASVRPEDRPVGMTSDERLAFWWYHDRSVTVAVGADP